MQRGKGTSNPSKKRLVWRITEARPLGEFVDPTEVPEPVRVVHTGDVPQPGWRASSFDLLQGVEVTEEDSSTVPSELFDELFGKSGASAPEPEAASGERARGTSI